MSREGLHPAGQDPRGREDKLVAILRQLKLEAPAAPQRADLLAALATTTTEETRMNTIRHFLSAQPWPLRIAAGLAALALLLALSQLLPFAGGPAIAPQVQAYSGGYVLVYEFGAQTLTEETHRRGQEILHQWFEDNGIQPEQLAINGGEDVIDGQYIFSLALIGASKEQAESLAAALSVIENVPQPRIVEASWYQVQAAEAEKRGELLLYEFDHAFVFTRGTSAEQIKQALEEYVIERDGALNYDIKVSIEWSDKGHCCDIVIDDKRSRQGGTHG
jgi:hypothetical protein